MGRGAKPHIGSTHGPLSSRGTRHHHDPREPLRSRTMPRYPVFTPEEISAFRRVINTYREPGAYAPGQWSVSPLNRRSDIVGTYPSKIVLRDIAVPTTEQM